MKQLLLLFALASTVIFTSCEGDPGPPGEPGINILGQVFEVNGDFVYNSGQNTYSTSLFSYPFEVFESDVVLVYRYEGQANIGGGETADLWTQLPQSIFYQDGTGDIFQYTFNHTFVDVQIVIDGNFDLTNLGNEFVDGEIFRIAVVPAEFADANLTMEQLEQSSDVDFVRLD